MNRVPIEDVLAALLAVHKTVLSAERASLERIHGPLSSAAFLQLVSDPVRFGWLRPLSGLILAFEEEDEEKRLPDDELLDRARALLLPPKEKEPFGRRYLSLMQRDPELVLAQGRLTRFL